jgi:hypothetical protein
MKHLLETLQSLPPEFCRKYGIQPFIIEEGENIDGILFAELMESLQSGYDASRPIVLAQGPPEIQGLVIDGKHRLCCIYALEEKKIPVRPQPSIMFEPITTMDQYRARVSHYLMVSKSKDPRLARRLIDRNLGVIVSGNLSLGDKLPEYINSLGFSSESTIKNVLHAVRKQRGVTRKAKRKNHDTTGLGDWNEVKMLDNNDSVYAGPKDDFDVMATQKTCPGCGVALVIMTKTDGRVMEVRRASETVPHQVSAKNVER